MSVSSEIQELNANLVAAKDAVEAKGGTVGDTGLSGLANEIESIPTSVKGDDIRFIDYDGTIVTQMSLEDAHNLTSLPEMPTHEGLSGIGWTHSLATVKSATRPLDVGAMYESAANPAQSIFYMLPRNNETVTLNFNQSAENGVTIDWGDGSATETVAGEGDVTVSHTYTAVTNIKKTPLALTLTPASGVTYKLGWGTTQKTLFNNGSSPYYTVVRAVVGASIQNFTFQYCYSLSSVVISNTITEIGNDAFRICYALSSVIIPNSVTTIGTGAFNFCSTLFSVVIPNSVTTIKDSAFTSCYSLSSIVIPDSLATIPASAFSACFSLSSVVIPSSVTSILNSAFTGCYALSSAKFADRATMPTGSGWAFPASTSGHCLYILDCSEFTQVPTVTVYFLNNMPPYTRILVPASLETRWKAASGWSTYANRIVGV